MTHCATGFRFCCLFFTGGRLIPDHPECLLSAGLVNRTRIRPRAVGLNPSALRGEARLRGLVRSLRLCPSSPLPLLAHREKGEFGHPEARLPLIAPTPFSHTGRRGSLGVLKPKAREEMQGLAKKPAAGSGDALGARASGAHPAGCLQPEKERQKRGRPAMTTTPLQRPFAPHPPFSHTGRKGSLGVLMAETGDGAQGLVKKPAAGSGDALGARASGAHPAGCLQPEKERQKRGRPAMTTTPLRRPFAPHPLWERGRRARIGVKHCVGHAPPNTRRNHDCCPTTCSCAGTSVRQESNAF